MRFASLESVRQGAAAALRRFPFPLACAWAACVFFDIAIFTNGTRVVSAGLLLTLGIPLTFALTLLAERSPGSSPIARWLPQLVVLLGLALLIWTWPQWNGDVQFRRYLQLSLFAHAVVAFVPYIGRHEPNGFWQYNRTLLERFILASIFASVLSSGLTGAVFALRPLFGIPVSPKVFALITTAVWLIFHPWFFLANIPADLGALEERRDYPGTVKIFAQFILVPLVGIYQALLTAYLFKVVITQQWPKGLIGWLVSVEAVAGILAILLIHPVRDRAENLWVRTFARVFYLALLPSIAMMAVAIAKRVGQYGVTEDRYFVIVLTGWLAAISLYFIARRDGDIRWIPTSLAVVALGTFAGPWGAYTVSRSSQHARLMHLLEANGMWKDGRVVPATRELPFETRRDVSSLLQYLLNRHGSAGLRPELAATIAAADSGIPNPEHDTAFNRATRVATRMGFEFVNQWQTRGPESGTFSWERPWNETQGASRIGGYDYHTRIESSDVPFDAGSSALRLFCDTDKHRFILGREHERHQNAVPMGPIDTLATASIDSLISATHALRVPGNPLPHVDFGGSGARGTLYVSRLMGSLDPDFRVTGLSGDLYFSLALADSSR